MPPDLRAELLQRGVTLTLLEPPAAQALGQRWSAIFAPPPPVGRRVYRWHTFSFRHYPCLEGDAALSTYLRQWRAPFYVFDEALDFCALCEAPVYPDLSELRDDLYVTHRNLKWAVAFTHEQPHVGPFFAERLTA